MLPRVDRTGGATAPAAASRFDVLLVWREREAGFATIFPAFHRVCLSRGGELHTLLKTGLSE